MGSLNGFYRSVTVSATSPYARRGKDEQREVPSPVKGKLSSACKKHIHDKCAMLNCGCTCHNEE